MYLGFFFCLSLFVT